MKKKILVLIYLLILISLTSCIREITIPIGNIPSEKFNVAEFVDDNAIYQAASVLTINGKSEQGVIIVARLFDSKNNLYSMAYSDTDNNGDWAIRLDTPDASFREYSLKISDSTDKYHETFNNIRFGEAWLIVGDEILNNKIDNEANVDAADLSEDIDVNYDNMFYQDGNWIPADSTISEFGYGLVLEIVETFKAWSKYPVAIVFASEDSTNIYEWISRELIESRRLIKEALVDNNIYVSLNEEVIESGMSYCYEKYLKKIIGMSFSNIVVNQGINDLIDANNNKFYQENEFNNLYFQMLYNFVSELESTFEVEEKIMIIQSHADYIDNLEQLRLIQSNVSNIYNNCEIVPTYDLTLVYDKIENEYIDKTNGQELLTDLEIHGFDIEKLATRIYNVSNNIISVPSLINCVQVYNDDKEIIEIRLIFNNIKEFKNYDTIEGLELYDLDGNLVEDIEYEISNNEIIINLTKTILGSVEDDKELESDSSNNYEEKIVLIEVSKVCYAFGNFNYFCNLETEDIVVDPFEIILKR